MSFLSIYKRIVYLFFVAVLALQCAQPSTPTGGEKDSDPPVLLSSVPENESVNFSSDKIEFFFDEYIQLKDPQNQILISPSLKNKPVFTVGKRSLLVELNDTLLENTTYSINFGESIVDNNEGNILKNFTYAFSTGNELDSLQVSGKVMDAYSGKPAENIKVMLYRTHSDSIPLTEKPDYFVQTNKEGRFTIQYLPEFSFKLFGCSDENGTLVYDEPIEKICFLDSLVSTSPSMRSDSLALFVFNEESELGYVDRLTTDSLGVYTCTFSESQKDVLLSSSSIDSIYYLWSEGSKKELSFFSSDTGQLIVKRYDSRFTNREIKLDTLDFPVIDSASISSFSKNCKVEYSGSSRTDFKTRLPFKVSRPLAGESVQIHVKQKDSLIETIDSLAIKNPFELEIDFSGEPESRYKLVILPNSIQTTDFSNLDSTTVNFSTFPENYYGELILDVKSDFKNPHLVILTKSGSEIYSQPYLNEPLTLSQVPPGELEIFMFDDLNLDQSWTTGNYLLNLQPEKNVKFNQEIEVRSNWSLSYTWILE